MVDCPCFENSSVRETFGTFAVWLNHSGNNPRLIRFATVAMISSCSCFANCFSEKRRMIGIYGIKDGCFLCWCCPIDPCANYSSNISLQVVESYCGIGVTFVLQRAGRQLFIADFSLSNEARYIPQTPAGSNSGMLQFQKLVSICRKVLHFNLLDSMNCRNACMIGDLRKSLFAFFPSQRCCGFMFSQKSYVICRQVFDVVLHKPKKFRLVKQIWKSCVIGAATSLYRKFHDTLTIGRTMETRRRAVHQQKPLTYSIFPGTHGVYCFS